MKINKSVKIFFSLLLITVGFLGVASAATLNVNPQYLNERNVIVSAADRLVALQNNDGSWEWSNPDTDPTTTNYPAENNVLGVTARGLVKAYLLTGNQNYLNAAKKTADLLVSKNPTGMSLPDNATTHKVFAQDISFLIDFSQAYSKSGNDGTIYSSKANDYMNTILNQPNRFCTNGCAQNASELVQANFDRRQPNLFGWDIEGWVEAAVKTGNNQFANDVVTAMTTKFSSLSNTATGSIGGAGANYVLGLSGYLQSYALTNTNFDAVKTQLLAEKNISDNSFNVYDPANDGIKQTTAYAITAFNEANDHLSILGSLNYLVLTQATDGGWIESDGTEYTETDSEIIQAIYNSIYVPDTYYTINDAITAALPGDTINVAAGTYNEQLIINKSLTLQGVGDTTIIQPSQTTANKFQLFDRTLGGVANTAGIIVTNAGTDSQIIIKDLKVDGSLISSTPSNARLIGILYRGSNGLIDSTTIDGININEGNAILSSGYNSPVNVEIKNNIISNYLKNGITANNQGMNANIHDNMITGMGPTTSIAQNGIQIGFGAVGTITHNTIKDNVWTGIYSTAIDNNPTTDINADGAAGILLYSTGLSPIKISQNNLVGNQFGIWSVVAPNINIQNNNITGLVHTGNAFPTGIAIASADMWTNELGGTETGTIGTVVNNHISLNDYGIIVLKYGTLSPNIEINYNSMITNNLASLWTNIIGTLNAQQNYFGDNPDFSKLIVGNVLHTPYFTDADMKHLNIGGILGTDASTTNKTITLPSAETDFDVSTSVGVVKIILPADLIITGDSLWDGILDTQESNMNATASAGNQISATYFATELGVPNMSLTFNKAVQIILPGQAGRLVGYSVSGTDFTPITTECNLTSQTADDFLLSSGKTECKLNDSSNLVVWTKHFTTFITYAEAPLPPVIQNNPSNNVGGGGGGAGGAGGASLPPVVTTNDTTNKTNLSTPTTPTNENKSTTSLLTGKTIMDFAKGKGITIGAVVFALIIGLVVFSKIRKKRVN